MNTFFQNIIVFLCIMVFVIVMCLLTQTLFHKEDNNLPIKVSHFTKIYDIDGFFGKGASVYRYNYNNKYYLINNRGGIIEIESPELKK